MNIIKSFTTKFLNLVKEILDTTPPRYQKHKPDRRYSPDPTDEFYKTLIFIEQYANHKILKHPTENIFYIKKRKIKAHRKNRSILVLNGNKDIRTFKSLESAQGWVNNRWGEKRW